VLPSLLRCTAVCQTCRKGTNHALVFVWGLLLRGRFSRERSSALHERRVRASVPDAIRFPTRQGPVFANRQRALGALNLAVGYLLVCHVGEFHVRRIPDVLVLGAGGLLMAVMLSRVFGRLYGGQ